MFYVPANTGYMGDGPTHGCIDDMALTRQLVSIFRCIVERCLHGKSDLLQNLGLWVSRPRVGGGVVEPHNSTAGA